MYKTTLGTVRLLGDILLEGWIHLVFPTKREKNEDWKRSQMEKGETFYSKNAYMYESPRATPRLGKNFFLKIVTENHLLSSAFWFLAIKVVISVKPNCWGVVQVVPVKFQTNPINSIDFSEKNCFGSFQSLIVRHQSRLKETWVKNYWTNAKSIGRANSIPREWFEAWA